MLSPKSQAFHINVTAHLSVKIEGIIIKNNYKSESMIVNRLRHMK